MNITQLTAEWQQPEPDDTPGVVYSTVGTQIQVRWGSSLVGSKPGLGFTPAPAGTVWELGTPGFLGTLQVFHRTVVAGEEAPTSIELDIDLRISTGEKLAATLKFELDYDASSLSVEIGGSLPRLLSQDGIELRLLGFSGTTTLTAELDASALGTVEVELVQTPQQESHCVPGQFPPVFTPARCSIEAVCPISDDLIIVDCGIPEAPGPITDCPELDLPDFLNPAFFLLLETTPGVGGVGPAGPAGPAGQNGCTPKITVTYNYFCGDETRVIVSQTDVPPCGKHLHFVFIQKCGGGGDSSGCCWFIWCNGTWTEYQRGTGVGEGECPTAPDDTTCPGCVEGEIKIVCPCETTTTTEEPCVETECGDFRQTMSVAVTDGDNCTCDFGSDTTAVWSDGGWRAAPTTGCAAGASLNLFCSGSGAWQLQVCCGTGDCVTVAAAAAAVDATRVSISASVDTGMLGCCSGPSQSMLITFIGTLCELSECIDTDCGEIRSELELTVTDLSGGPCTCAWPTSVTWDGVSAWEGAATGCDPAAEIRLLCSGTGSLIAEVRCAADSAAYGAVTATEADGKVTYTADVVVNGLSCCPDPTTLRLEFVADMCSDPSTSTSSTTVPPTPEPECITGTCGNFLDTSATASIIMPAGCGTGGTISGDMVYDAEGSVWRIVSDAVTLEFRCVSNLPSLTLIANGESYSLQPAEVDEEDGTVTFSASFDTANFPSYCGSTTDTIDVSVNITTCDTPSSSSSTTSDPCVESPCAWLSEELGAEIYESNCTFASGVETSLLYDTERELWESPAGDLQLICELGTKWVIRLACEGSSSFVEVDATVVNDGAGTYYITGRFPTDAFECCVIASDEPDPGSTSYPDTYVTVIITAYTCGGSSTTEPCLATDCGYNIRPSVSASWSIDSPCGPAAFTKPADLVFDNSNYYTGELLPGAHWLWVASSQTADGTPFYLSLVCAENSWQIVMQVGANRILFYAMTEDLGGNMLRLYAVGPLDTSDALYSVLCPAGSSGSKPFTISFIVTKCT